MQSQALRSQPYQEAMKLVDFGQLQQRYQAMPLSVRAKAVLVDAEPALQAADRILQELAGQAKVHTVFEALRKNSALIGKMRPSEAKNMLLDPANDFVPVTRQKLQAWRKTMERLAAGEGVVQESKREYIPLHMPLAAALASICTAGSYLSIIQIGLSELAKADGTHGGKYLVDLAKIRRCAILLSDCENASSISALVH